MGLGMQQPSMAAQTALERKDVSVGVSLMFFGQSLGGAVFISVAQNVFTNKLVSGLASVVGLNPTVVLSTGATDLRRVVAPGELASVLSAYNKAVTTAFFVSVGVACFSILPALTMEWKSVKGRKHGQERKEGVVEGKGGLTEEKQTV
jgi:hypothetical protein